MAATVQGFRATGLHVGIKKSGALDLALIASDRPAVAAALFTRNRFPGAPIIVSREHLRGGRAQAIVVNSGISNVATGAKGVANARRMARCAADALELSARRVQVASTGVIGQALPIDLIERGIKKAAIELSTRGWMRAARAIMTTDTRPKLSHVQTRQFGLLGIAKGSGMVMPDLATMLSYLVTDLAVEPAFLRASLKEAVAETFNRLTIDGETSTSDTVLILANGAAGNRPIGPRSALARPFKKALMERCEDLVTQLAADAEGVTRLADIVVTGARTDRDADKAARKVANSVLVKTAIFGVDPNWGRIVQAVGAAGVAFKPEDLGVRIGGVELLRGGRPVTASGTLTRAKRAMKKKRVLIQICLGRGRGQAKILTCDLGYGYVRINAEYTT